MNPFFAGQITKEYQITKVENFDPFLEEMGRAYQKAWEHYPKKKLKDLKVESVWVNMQKKLEVNPIHNHDGTS